MTKHAPRLKRLPIPAALARRFATGTLLLPGLAFAGGGPSGGVVVGGHATISNPAPNGTVITETSSSAVINWQQFSIGSGDYVQFIQPSASSVVLNRVIGGSPSQILGDLSANGRVFLVNPNGVLFGKGAQLDVGGLVASTMNISNADFLAGHYVFSGGGAPGSSVVNAGTIKTADGGFVVLAGDYVNNTGVIQARLGQVVLASGASTTLDLDGTGLVSFAVNQATLAQKAGVNNAGQIIADGGRVIMTAQTAHDLVGSAVNNTGLVRAEGIANHNGEIELTASGGDIADSGTLDVSSGSGSGGTVKIDADRNIDIQQGAQILASGSQGGAVSIIADGTLNTRAGSLIDALGSAGPGGYTELSGHGALTVRGDLDLGRGGTLVIDPLNLTIASGAGTSNSATVYESTVVTALQGGSNVQLVAGNSITLASLGNVVLDGRNGNQSGGSLLLGIGSISGGNNLGVGGTYTEGSGGTISFADPKDSIAVDAGLTIDAGSATGTVTTGGLIGGFVNVKGADGITTHSITTTGFTPSTGNPTVDNGAITLTASNGNISTGTLTTGVSTPCSVSCPTTAIGSVTINAGGGIQLGDITTVAKALGSTGSSVADASVTINGNNANLGGDVGIGSITTAASTVKGTGKAYVAIADNNSGGEGGTLSVAGITTLLAESPQSGDVHVTLSNSNGSIDLSGFTITTDGSAAQSYDGDVTLNTNGGGAINVAAITATNSAINASTSGGGNITFGELSPGVASTDAFTSIDLESSGTLSVGGTSTSLSADSITLSAGSGSLSFGVLTATGDSINLNAGNGSITTGNLTAVNSAITATAGGGSISMGTLSGGSGILTSVNLTASGSVSTQSTSITAGSITLSAGSGNLSFGTLDASSGNIKVTASGGAIGDTALLATGGSITLSAGQGINIGAATAGSAFGATNNSGSVVLGTLGAGEGGISVTNNSGNITLSGTGASTTGGGGISVTATAGGIAYTGAVNASGNVDFTASGEISTNGGTNALSAGTTASLTGGSLALYNVTGGSGVSLTATGGNASFNGLTATSGMLGVTDTGGIIKGSNLTASNGSISLTGDQGIAVTTASASNSFSATNNGGNVALGSLSAGAGGISITSNSGDVLLDGTGASTTAGGDITVSAPGGGITYTNAVNASGTVDFTASGQISANGDPNILSAGGTVSITGGSLNLYTVSGGGSADRLTATAGDLDTSAIVASGAIQLSDTGGNIVVGNLTATNSAITVNTYSGSGNVTVGSLSGGSGPTDELSSISISAVGSLTAANTDIVAGSIGIGAGAGLLSTGNLSATSGNLILTNSGGNIKTGNLSASDSSSNGASATISVYAAGGVSVGSVTTNAQTNSGSASAYVQIEANSSHNISTQLGGDLVVGGPISTNAFTNGEEGVANANAELDNGKGSISTGGNSITTAAKATVGSVEANITLAATAGDITAAGLNVIGGGSIGVSTTSSGNISVGQLSATSGSLSDVSLTSAGSLSTNNTDITTGTITLSAANGDLDTGNLTTTLYGISLTDAGGTMALGNVLSAGGIALTNTNGGISTGSLTSVDNIFITSAGTSGTVSTGPLAAVSGTLGTVDISASAGLTVGGSSVTAGVITLSAANGDLTAGNLTGTYGNVTISDANGTTILGNISGDAPVSITNSNGSIGTGTIAAVDGSSITVTAAGSSGNISVGTLSGGDGPLGLIDLVAAGTLTTADTNFSAGSVTLSAGAGSLSLGTLTASSGALTISDSAGSISTGILSAGSDVTLTATGGTVKVGGPITLGNAGNGALTISATDVQTGDITNNSPLAAVGSGNDISITASAGNINIGNVGTAGTGTVALTLAAAAGTITAGSINVEVLDAQASGNVDVGTLTLNSLTPGGASNLVSSAGSVTAGPVTSNHGLDVAAQTGISLGAVNVVNGLQVDSAGGTISTGDLTDSGAGVSVVNGGTALTIGNVSADGNIQIGSVHGGVDTGNLSAGSGTLTLMSNGALSVGEVSASSVTAVTNGANAKYGDLNSSGVINLTVNGGNLSTGDITGNQVFTTLDTGNEQVGNVNVTGTNFFFSMGDVAGQTLSIGSLDFAGTATVTFGFTNTNFSIGSVNVGGGFVANLGNGSLNTGNIVAGAISLNDDHGTLSAGNLTASGGTVSVMGGGSNVALGNVLAGGAVTLQSNGTLVLDRSISGQSVSLSAGLGISDSGALTVTASSGDLSLASALAANGDIDLSAANGALTFGNLSGANITLSTGQALNLGGNSINASGNFTLTAGGNTSINNSSINAVNATITSGGTLDIGDSSVLAQTVALNASGDLAISGGSSIGDPSQFDGLASAPQALFTANSSVTVTSGGNVSIDHSALEAAQVSINGGAIQLANGAALDGGAVALTGTGAVGSGAGSSTIDAGALSVRGGSINFSSASLSVGSGSAAFGSDSALLTKIHAKAPTLAVPSHGPNASFAAAGGVTLGQISIAGGYLFIQAPSLQLPSALSGNSNMFIDFLPSNPAALLNVNLKQPLTGITTLVFGGTPQTGNIEVGNGTQTFALSSNTNLVFATSGATLYPDSISSNGQVVVLGESVLRSSPIGLADIPLTIDQYTIDQPDTGILAYDGDPGDVNDPGVNNANKGRIDIRTSTPQTLSCGIGGAQ